MMQLGLLVIVLAVGYGVAFSLAYPLVQVDSSIAALCAMLGLLTALAIAGAWKAVTKK